MKMILLIAGFVFGQVAFAGAPPAGYPVVNAVVRKINVAGARISLKHDEIPNLSMPGMTMSFAVQNPNELTGLAVGDQVQFTADEIDGEITVLWIEKAEAVEIASVDLFCTGVAPTTPPTNIELEIRKHKLSTIRYEFAEGSYLGTAYVNSIGRMDLTQIDGLNVYQSANPSDFGRLDSKLEVRMENGQIAESRFTSFGSGMANAPVHCRVAR